MGVSRKSPPNVLVEWPRIWGEGGFKGCCPPAETSEYNFSQLFESCVFELGLAVHEQKQLPGEVHTAGKVHRGSTVR